MAFLGDRATDDRWQAYQQLELIPNSVPNPYYNATQFGFGLGWTWRHFVRLVIDELIDEQQVEYLDRCWALNQPENAKVRSSRLRQLLVLMS